MKTEKRVVAVIVTHNRLEKLKTCWRALSCQGLYGAILVNNNSTDGTKEWLDHLDDERVRPLHIEKNVGGAGGFKKGCDYGMRAFPEAEWFLLLDDDAYAQSDLLEAFQKAPEDSDLVSTKVLLPSGCPTRMNTPLLKAPESIGDVISYLIRRKKFAVDIHGCVDPVKVAVSSFVGLFVSSRCMEQMVGAILPEFFIYCDDAYFTFQASSAGFKNYFMPNLVFFHDTEASKLYKAKLYYLIRNDVVLKKAYSPKYFYLIVAFRFVYYAAKKFMADRTWSHLPLMFRAVLDGVNHNLERKPYVI